MRYFIEEKKQKSYLAIHCWHFQEYWDLQMLFFTFPSAAVAFYTASLLPKSDELAPVIAMVEVSNTLIRKVFFTSM